MYPQQVEQLVLLTGLDIYRGSQQKGLVVNLHHDYHKVYLVCNRREGPWWSLGHPSPPKGSMPGSPEREKPEPPAENCIAAVAAWPLRLQV